jgi:hypothetical protein
MHTNRTPIQLLKLYPITITNILVYEEPDWLIVEPERKAGSWLNDMVD